MSEVHDPTPMPICQFIIKQLITFWHSGALCTGVPKRQKMIKNSNGDVPISDFIRLIHAAETGSV